MTKPSIVCVVPSIRETMMESFCKAWSHLFKKHQVTLITVWDGEEPLVSIDEPDGRCIHLTWGDWNEEKRGLVCRRTDAVRNIGFITAAAMGSSPMKAVSKCDFILTLDDDVHPPAGSDPIQEHLDVLNRKVPTSWMNTAMDTHPGMPYVEHHGDGSFRFAVPSTTEQVSYLRGFPYNIRDESQVVVSHGVWVNVPDFDGKTQLALTHNGTKPEKLPYSLPYFRGPVPRGCYFPFCGMNVMVRKEALPYLYFAPMGPDSGVEGLNRFADIWCGILLKRVCDSLGWAIYTGASTVIHTRASDPFKNVEQEKLGIEWNEWAWKPKIDDAPSDFRRYWMSYMDKAARFSRVIRKLQEGS